MRSPILFCIMLYLIVAAGVYVAWSHDLIVKCVDGEPCFREWLSASSGWAAVFAAIPTILYLSAQVRDADRHQRTDFAIQLRKQRVLAARALQIADTATMMIRVSEDSAGEGRDDIRLWDLETVEGIVHHLRESTLSSFESEIDNPIGIGAWGTALVVERAMSGNLEALASAPDIVQSYFADLAQQARDYLEEVQKITGSRST